MFKTVVGPWVRVVGRVPTVVGEEEGVLVGKGVGRVPPVCAFVLVVKVAGVVGVAGVVVTTDEGGRVVGVGVVTVLDCSLWDAGLGGWELCVVRPKTRAEIAKVPVAAAAAV